MKILFIQHARALGGSALSLLYMMRGLRQLGHECVVALAQPSEKIEMLYREEGFCVEKMTDFAIFKHCNGSHYPWYWWRTWFIMYGVFKRWRNSSKSTLQVVRTVNPDIIHLNGMPLSVCATALSCAGYPYVWHIRETPPNQGLRTRWLRRVMLSAPKLIFISSYDRAQWVRSSSGEVIPNFVDPDVFSPNKHSPETKERLGILGNKKVILYLGGYVEVKGVFPLLKALARLKRRRTDFVCLMPGATKAYRYSKVFEMLRKVAKLFGHLSDADKAEALTRRYALSDFVKPMPFITNIAPVMSVADVVVFPSVLPHFARPVLEATAMEKAVVASDLGGVEELVAENPFGFIARAGDEIDLEEKIFMALDLQNLNLVGSRQVFQGFREDYSTKNRCDQIQSIYNKVLESFHHVR